MSEFESAELDYEPRGKSANVVDTPEGAKRKTPLQQGAGNEERKRETDLVRLETTKGKPGGAGETVSKEASVP